MFEGDRIVVHGKIGNKWICAVGHFLRSKNKISVSVEQIMAGKCEHKFISTTEEKDMRHRGGDVHYLDSVGESTQPCRRNDLVV